MGFRGGVDGPRPKAGIETWQTGVGKPQTTGVGQHETKPLGGAKTTMASEERNSEPHFGNVNFKGRPVVLLYQIACYQPRPAQ